MENWKAHFLPSIPFSPLGKRVSVLGILWKSFSVFRPTPFHSDANTQRNRIRITVSGILPLPPTNISFTSNQVRKWPHHINHFTQPLIILSLFIHTHFLFEIFCGESRLWKVMYCSHTFDGVWGSGVLRRHRRHHWQTTGDLGQWTQWNIDRTQMELEFN